MSSDDLFVFENSIFSDPFPPFIDSPIIIDNDIFQTISEPFDNNSTNQNQLKETNFIHQIAPTFLSSSPPSHQLGNLSLSQTTHLENDYYAGFSDLEFNGNSFVPHSYVGNSAEILAKLMKRSYSLLESPNFQTQVCSSPQSSFTTGQMRRVCSTGDLQKIKTGQKSQMSLATESSFMEEANFKVRRYSAEEKKERIHRYRAKRNQRNFTKTIKYACRKTLADSRPRIRGRFASNDEAGELLKSARFKRFEDDDDLWNIDGLNEEDDEGTVSTRGPFFNSFVSPHF